MLACRVPRTNIIIYYLVPLVPRGPLFWYLSVICLCCCMIYQSCGTNTVQHRDVVGGSRVEQTFYRLLPANVTIYFSVPAARYGFLYVCLTSPGRFHTPQLGPFFSQVYSNGLIRFRKHTCTQTLDDPFPALLRFKI